MEFTRKEILMKYYQLLSEADKESPTQEDRLSDLRLFEKMITKKYGRESLIGLLNQIRG